MNRQWSQFQQDVFRFIEKEEGNLLIEATAGSGKTTTIVEGINYVPRNHDVLFLAFNKHIADELRKRVPKNCTASTFNAFGWGICRRAMPGVVLRTDKDGYTKNELILRSFVDAELDAARFWRIRGPILRLVSVLKAYNYDGSWDWRDVLDPCGIELPEHKEGDDFAGVLGKVFNLSVKDVGLMDFDDQIYQVVRRNLPLPRYDDVFVDESQDLNPIQIEILRRLGENGSRIIAVGDRFQAIYAFRGADSNAIDRIVTTLDCSVLPLSICYRCPDSVIHEAQTVNETILAPTPNARGSGIVATVSSEDFDKDVKEGDYALCRTVAPLVQKCLRCIQLGRNATVKGRDIGDSLIEMIEKINGAPLHSEVDALRNGIFPAEPTFPPFADRLQQYRLVQSARLESQGKEQQMIVLNDSIDTILVIGESCDHVGEVILKILNIFSDKSTGGIMLMTIHKAKGLEAETIYILRPELLPHPKAKSERALIQERNLKFVAITRSMQNLYWVEKGKNE